MDGGAMSEPGFAALAALLGDPARSRMLTALMSGTALTATELALQGAVSASTASTHLAKLTEARILKVVRQGRHRYFRLFDQEVASMLETRRATPRRNAGVPLLRSPPHASATTTWRERRVCGWPLLYAIVVSSPAMTSSS
jgi:DNA-binding transcriptional ArsR family regulator